MRAILFIFIFLFSLKCPAQVVTSKNDTLLKKENGSLLLDNGFAIPPFSVSGDIYITNDLFIFHPKPYHGKRYEMYSDLVKDVILPYDSILVAKSASIFGGLTLKTKTKRYKIAIGGKGRTIITQINKLRKEHKAK
jgi:hypothetical protein